MPVTMAPIENSSNLAAAGFDPATGEMHIRFKSGETHAFAAVPADVRKAFAEAESKGKFFHANIKGRFASRKVAL